MKKKCENKNFNFIKNFAKIKVSKICEKLNIDKANVLNGKTTNENYKKVKDEIINQIFSIGGDDNH